MFEDMYSQEAVTRDWGKYQREIGFAEGFAEGREIAKEEIRKALRERADELGLSKELQEYLFGDLLC